MKSTKNKLIVILGPTASGKTDLSIKLAKKYNGEIVSADSRQIYRQMDIGTAKPTKKEQSKVPHFLIDIKNPNKIYNVAEYKKDAVKTIRKILKKDKLPILVGGTGLYIKAVVENLDIPKIKTSPSLRKKIETEIKEKGLGCVFQKLIKLDPEAAYIVDPKNPRRVIRALEITLLTKKPFSAQRKKGNPLFDVLEIGINVPKEKLRQRINLRAEKMIEQGLIKEVQNLIKKYKVDEQAFDAIGYREIIEYLSGKITLQEALEKIKTNTWHYAKRQMTWFNKDKKIHWISKSKQAEKLFKQFFK
jgi:tRNA dimethylallyltransferase